MSQAEATGPETPFEDGGAPWWVDLYDDTIADLYLNHEDPADRAATVAFLIEELALQRLPPGSLVYDQCCGTGRLTVALAEELRRRGVDGVRFLGVDQAPTYADRARAIATAAAAPCRFVFVQADARRYAPEAPCDAVLNWGTGFGNAESDADNQRLLERAFCALRPGGRLVLDVQNVPRILASFQPVLLRRGQTQRGEVLLLRESTLDLMGGALRQVWTCLLPDGQRRVSRSAVRLYLPHVIIAMLRDCGFTDIALFGDVSQGPCTAHSPRCILRAVRP